MVGNIVLGPTEDVPVVSVVIPTYNRAHLIGRSIRSVLAQSFQKFEIIVVDDGSMDNTEEVIREIQDERIRYIGCDENRGGGAARNVGIEAARGEYISFLDSDDEWLSLKLEKQLEVFSKANGVALGVVFCGMRVIDDNTGRIIDTNSPDVPEEESWLFESLFARKIRALTSTLLLTRECVDDGIRFDPELPASQDWDFVVRLSTGWRFIAIPEILVDKRKYDGIRISNYTNKIAARESLLIKYSHELRERPKLLSQQHYELALDHYQIGNVGNARRHFFKAFQSHLANYKAAAYFALSLLERQESNRLFISTKNVMKKFRN